MEKSLYGLGSTTVLSVRAVGMAYAKIAVDDVCPGQVLLLVMPDTVQQLDVIIGREWPDMPSVEYRKVDGQLHLYRAEPCSGQIEPTVTTVGCDADYIHTVEVREIPVRLPLLESDFGYVKSDVTAVEREGLLELVNEYRDCFAKDLGLNLASASCFYEPALARRSGSLVRKIRLKARLPSPLRAA
ncbi:hypothetical protein QTP88_019291 [Uroleucon formosanum]